MSKHHHRIWHEDQYVTYTQWKNKIRIKNIKLCVFRVNYLLIKDGSVERSHCNTNRLHVG